MEQNPSFRERNDYDGVDPRDGTPKHPNKYELIEKRKEQIDSAIVSLFQSQKEDILKRPVIGVVQLVQRELQRQGGVVLKTEKEKDDFTAEYHTWAIIPQLAKFVGYKDENDLVGLDRRIKEYCKS